MKIITFLISVIVSMINMSAIQSCKSSGKASTSKLLKFNLEKGKGYDYDIVWDMNTKVMGQETNINIDGLFSMNIIEDDGKIKSVATSYKSLNMNMKVGGVEMDLNSDKRSEDSSETEKNPIAMMRKVFSGIIGKTFIIKVDNEGKVLEVTGFDKIINDMIDSMGIDEDIKTQVM